MKNIFTLLFLFAIVYLSGQDVSFQFENMSEGLRSSAQILMPDVNAKFVDGVWKSYIRKYGGKYKYNRRAVEHLNEGSTIPNISNQSIDVYASSRPAGNSTRFFIWFKSGEDFLSLDTTSNLGEETTIFLRHFALEVAREKLREDIKEEEKSLSKLENDLRKLERQNEKLHKDIEDFKNRIIKAEQDIVENVQQQESTTSSIENQKVRLEQLQSDLKKL